MMQVVLEWDPSFEELIFHSKQIAHQAKLEPGKHGQGVRLVKHCMQLENAEPKAKQIVCSVLHLFAFQTRP